MEQDFYIQKIASLSVKITDGHKKPNKAILLLSVIDLIRIEYIVNNRIPLDQTIEATFKKMWELYIDVKVPSVWIPFWNMKREPFWHFAPKHSMKEIESLARPGETAPYGKMRRSIKYAYLDEDFYLLINEKSHRDAFIAELLKYV